jgi:mediator of RNA polymerase II transcription subunit 18
MYEVFLSAAIEPGQFDDVCAVLSGVCRYTAPWKTLNRVVYYRGPDKPVGLRRMENVDQTAKQEDPENRTLWEELHHITSKQSYLVKAKYELQAGDFGPRPDGEPPMNLDATKGTLEFTDFPDPVQPAKPLLMQRKIIELWDQRNLPCVLADNKYT